MGSTEEYIAKLKKLKAGDLGLLRTHAGQGLDETVEGFDLFAGLWWPLRQKSPRAPRREVAWLVVKLYAFRPIEHSPDDTLGRQLGKCSTARGVDKKRFEKKFDEMLMLPLDKIETPLQWALDVIATKNLKLDWVKLTDDLSRWKDENVRLRWAEEFLAVDERRKQC